MYKNFLVLFSCFLLMCGCKDQEKKEEKVVKKPEMSIVVKHGASKKIDSHSQNKIKNWKEYFEMEDFLTRFEKTSPNEALSNAIELKELAKKLKDSIRVEELKTPALKARVNVLENETLRLVDMTYIPAITPKEVNVQVEKIFLVFNSLNAKITSFYNQKRLDDNLNLDNFLELDSTEVRNSKNRTSDKKEVLQKQKLPKELKIDDKLKPVAR